MNILIDETGAFEALKQGDFGIVTLVSVTDTEIIKLKKFLETLFPAEYTEVKANNISLEKREKLLKYIGRKQEIKYSAFLFDTNLANPTTIKEHQDKQVSRIKEWLINNPQAVKEVRREIQLLHNQIKNLKTADFLKFLMIHVAYRDWLEVFQFDFRHISIKNDTWNFKHIIDLQNKPQKFQYITKEFLHATSQQGINDFKIYCPKEWQGKNHPLEEKYRFKNEEGKFDAKTFFSDFKITTEQEESLLLIPDLIGNSIFKSINNQKDTRWLKILKRIKPNRSVSMTLKDSSIYYVIININLGKTTSDVSEKIKKHYRLMKTI